jgi:hypothetical protein
MSAIPDRKAQLLTAFKAEQKAQQIYDMMWEAFTPKEKQNVGLTLIEIIYHGFKDEYKKADAQYRKDKTLLSAPELQDIQMYNRSAMAFSRRKAKTIDAMDDSIETLLAKVANTVSGSTNKEEKKERTPKQENPEKILVKLIDMIERNDVKILLQQALMQLKLTTTVTGYTTGVPTSHLNDNDYDVKDTHTSEVWW